MDDHIKRLLKEVVKDLTNEGENMGGLLYTKEEVVYRLRETDLSPVCAVCEETAKAWLLKTITNADEHSIALVDAYYEITLKASNVDSVTVDQYFESLPQAPLDLFSIARIVLARRRNGRLGCMVKAPGHTGKN